MELIKQRAIVTDDFTVVADDQAVPATGPVFVSLSRWKADKASLAARDGKTGVRLKSNEMAEELVGDLGKLAAIAIEFPKFRDGRGFSTARLLRERHAYKGEIRAVGHVIREQLFYMSRCGFDAFELAPGKDLQDALTAFGEFTVTYQPGTDDPRPLYRRR